MPKMISTNKATSDNFHDDGNLETIKHQQQVIQHLSNRLDKAAKINDLIRDYDTGKMCAGTVISYLRVYIKE